MTSTLSDFGVSEMLRCSIGLREATQNAPTMEAAAREAARFLYDELVDGEERPACALVRCYKTHLYRTLDRDLQAFARRMLPPGTLPSHALRCLTLLATWASVRNGTIGAHRRDIKRFLCRRHRWSNARRWWRS
jgi:hypothetical protein